jgi:hypothetical protein
MCREAIFRSGEIVGELLKLECCRARVEMTNPYIALSHFRSLFHKWARRSVEVR